MPKVKLVPATCFPVSMARGASWDIDLNSLLPENLRSAFLIEDNVFRGAVGLAFDQTFGAGNACLITGNNVENVADLGIYLGPGTMVGTVVGGSNKTNVLDLGTGNILVGVNNMGTGIGPTITHFLKNK